MNEETTERGLLPGTPEMVSSVGDGNNSTAESASTASLSQSRKEGKIVPHYLRASVGSCHDFCKYGRRHSFRSRGKHHAFPLFAGSHSAPEKEQHRVKIPSLAEKRKKSAAKQKASAHSKTGLYDKHVILEEESPRPVKTIKPAEETEIIHQFLEKHLLSGGPEVTECNLPTPSKKFEPHGEFESSKQGTPLKGTVLCDDPEMSLEEMSLLVKKAEASGDSETANIKNLHEKPDSSLEPAGPAPTEQRTRSSKNPFASIKSKFMQKVPSPLKKVLSSGKSKVSNQEVATSSTKRSDASARSGLPAKSKGTAVNLVSPLNPTAGTTSNKSESKSLKNVNLFTHDDKKTLKPPPTSLSSQPALSRISSFALRKVKITRSSSVKRPKKVEKAEGINEKVKEKTLYVVEPRSAVDKTSGARRSSSVLNQEKKNRDSESASIPKHGRTKVTKTAQSEDKKNWRKGVTNHPEDKDPASNKLKFRRGKMVDPQSVNDVPRRILFRQGRRTGDNQSSKSGRRSFKSRDLGRGVSNQPCPEAEIVVLRHQDVPEREAQGLFNDVIEETANKLVKTRNSKVKALVGAFETVISLQESKPAASV